MKTTAFISILTFSLLLGASIMLTKPSITGNSQIEIGNITIGVSSVLSITTIDDDTINFSGCTAGNTIYSYIDNGSTDNACPGFTADEILIRNDGNTPANVSVNISNRGEAHGGTFVNSTTDDSWIAYRITNSSSGSYSGGCIGNYQGNLTNVTSSNYTLACDNLKSETIENSFEFDIAIYIPPTTTPSSSEVVITFQANSVI